MKLTLTIIGLNMAAVIFLQGCGKSRSQLRDTNSPLLSQTGLYTNITDKVVDPKNSFFKPNYSLWTDGAAKQRWIQLPAGTKINNEDMNRWVFPLGTKIWKEFLFLGKRVETRYLEKTSEAANISSWQLSTYIWDAQESEATLAPTDGAQDVAFTGYMTNGDLALSHELGTQHDVPATYDCRSCHNRGGDAPLSFDAIQLSGADPQGLTLQKLLTEELLTKPITTLPEIVGVDPQTKSVVGYLHANCGGCHNPAASAGRMTGLHLRYDVDVQVSGNIPALATGLNQLTRYFEVPGRTVGVDSFRIEGGAPDFSAIYLRTNSREGGIAMPPTGSEVVNRDFQKVLYDWIKAQPPL